MVDHRGDFVRRIWQRVIEGSQAETAADADALGVVNRVEGVTVAPGQDAGDFHGSAAAAGVESKSGRRWWDVGALFGHGPKRLQGVGEAGPMGSEPQGRDNAGAIFRRAAESSDQRVVAGGWRSPQGRGNRVAGGGDIAFPDGLLVGIVGKGNFDEQVRGLIANPSPQVAAFRAGLFRVETAVGRETLGKVGRISSRRFPVAAGQGVGIAGGEGAEGHAGGSGCPRTGKQIERDEDARSVHGLAAQASDQQDRGTVVVIGKRQAAVVDESQHRPPQGGKTDGDGLPAFRAALADQVDEGGVDIGGVHGAHGRSQRSRMWADNIIAVVHSRSAF